MLKQLSLSHFRLFDEAQLQFSSGVTWIVGENGCGKTSLLEAISFLSSAKSFRTSRASRLIQQGQTNFTLYAELDVNATSHRLGIQRNHEGIASVRLDGSTPSRLSELAYLLPVQVFHPDSIRLVTGEASSRRSFLDWGVFHVEHTYSTVMRDFKQVLQQRNKLLKAWKPNLSELSVWSQQLVALSDRIDQLRSSYVKRLSVHFQQALRCFPELPSVECRYSRGWPKASDLGTLLQENSEKALVRGFTAYGPHRADLRLHVEDGTPVKEVLSRGQCKIVSYALLLAQLYSLVQEQEQNCLLLVDDLASELDARNRHALFTALFALQQQMVITSLEADFLIDKRNRSDKVFHVEHGQFVAS